jgi:F-type H+-transporting ATPase subunit b
MRVVWIGLLAVLLGCGAFLHSGAPARAAEPDQAQTKKKYSAVIHTPEGEKEKSFDLTQPAHANELNDLLTSGELEELKKEKEISILSLSWDLGLWTLVVFGLLLYTLRRLAWKPMLEGLHRRESTIREALTEAQKAREEAQQLQARLKAEMDQAQGKVREVLEEAHRHAQETTDEMVARARAEIQTERDRLRREIDLARDQALQHLWSQAAQLATLVAAKAIRRQLNSDDHRRLVDEAIADLQRAGTERQRGL